MKGAWKAEEVGVNEWTGIIGIIVAILIPAVSGIILGWVYLRYGFVTSLLIHWATNYFIFSYATFISQINFISIEDAFSHSLMSSLELLFLIAGIFSIGILFIDRFFSKKETTLEI